MEKLYNWQPGKMHLPAKVGRVKHILAISMKVQGGGEGVRKRSARSRQERKVALCTSTESLVGLRFESKLRQ